MNKTNKKIRLESHTIPTKYKIEIKPDMDAFVFSGKETIKININKKIKQITLHSKDIDIETVKIYNKGKNNEQFASKISYNIKKETATFSFKKEIKKGSYELSIIFSGIISDTLRGFYKSKYHIDGEEKYIATTQFEATDARRAFPCFDEPAHKATFLVSFMVKDNYEVISNTLPISIDKHESGLKIINFSETPKMSTYLLAFIIGEFEYIEGKTKEGVEIRVFTTKGKKHQAKFALDVAIKSLEFYNEYFNIPYPLPNLDMIAIPDFESAAMENWGAITYRETAILVDEEHTSLVNKQWVATVVAHEIAHQWFGNLVTMHWWTDLWLNEGFASYMEKVCTDTLFPHWKIWDLHLGSARYKSAIEIDGLASSHPVEVEVHHPDEISEIFDMVSYEKGTAIIRMLALYIGEDKFKEGLSYYLKKHIYKNTKTLDLWQAFEKSSKKPVAKMMSSWTKQMGFPIIKETYKDDKCILSQERFFSSRVIRNKSKDKSLWQIPLVYKNTKGEEKLILIDKKSTFLNDKIKKLNSGDQSFLKVIHSEKTLDKIKKDIKENHLSIPDRINILRDIFSLAEGGYIKTSEALGLSLEFKNEKEYSVASELASGLIKISNLIDNEIVRNKMKSHILYVFKPIAQEIGFDKKTEDRNEDILLRSLVISLCGGSGDKEIIKEAKKIFDNRINKTIDKDIKSTIYGIVAKNGGQKEWKTFYEMYKSEEMHEEKERLTGAISLFKDKKILEKTLRFAISKDVKPQDAPFIIAKTWSNHEGRDATWKFLKDNWDTILKRYGEGGHFLSKLISPLKNHTKREDLIDIKKFFKGHTVPGGERTLLQAYEKIESNIAWIKDDMKDIENWLNKNY
ncbi:TPA: M1 family peptidase [Candidatus Nomurabacteria bacterium]|nr:MAG: hypothetical protein O210_OD1C00001G0332 [Parcubacteria bacterium RAAC4_OD1_1]HCY26428.1 M1 family peptidase [Candidatus Nomurabacteria bacterium]